MHTAEKSLAPASATKVLSVGQTKDKYEPATPTAPQAAASVTAPEVWAPLT